MLTWNQKIFCLFAWKIWCKQLMDYQNICLIYYRWLINYCSCNVRYRFKEQIVSIFEYISGIKHALNNIWATELNLICWTWCVDMFKILTSKCQIIWEGFVLFFPLWSTLLGLSYNKSFVYNKLWCFISAGLPENTVVI